MYQGTQNTNPGIMNIENYKDLSRWYLEIAERDAVIKGFSFMDKNSKIPGIV